MVIFRWVLCAAWLVLAWVSAQAVAAMGLSSAGDVFMGDFAHPWRAQFNTDFSLHIALVVAWIFYREKGVLRGFGFGACALMLGGFFTLAYIFVQTFTCNGSFKNLLLGHRASSSS